MTDDSCGYRKQPHYSLRLVIRLNIFDCYGRGDLGTAFLLPPPVDASAGTQTRACGLVVVSVGVVGVGEGAEQSSERHASSAKRCDTVGFHCMPGDRVDPPGGRRSRACEMVRDLRALEQPSSAAGGADGKTLAVFGAVYLGVLCRMQNPAVRDRRSSC